MKLTQRNTETLLRCLKAISEATNDLPDGMNKGIIKAQLSNIDTMLKYSSFDTLFEE